MPREKRQIAETRSRRKNEIMQAALRCYARSGIKGARAAEIAQEANISAGLLYSYFESLEDLATQVIKEAEIKLAGVLAGFDEVPEEARLIDFAKRFLTSLKRDAEFWKLFHIASLQSEDYSGFADWFIGGEDAGMRLLRGIDDDTMHLLGAMLDGIVYNYLARRDAFPLERVVERVFMILPGLLGDEAE